MDSISFAGHYSSDKRTIPSLGVAKFIIGSVDSFLSILKDQDIYGPASLSVSLINVKDYELILGNSLPHSLRHRRTADRDVIELPDVLIEDVSASSDVYVIARSALDILWQSFGLASCTFYDNEGNWKP